MDVYVNSIVGGCTGCPRKRGPFQERLILLEFSDNVSETFTYSFSFGTYNVYMHLSLSFVRFAELLDSKHKFFIIFQDFQQLLHY